MKIALAQINTTVGDFEGNYQQIKEAIDNASLSGANVIVFPELTLCGYPCRDLVDLVEFRYKNAVYERKVRVFSYDVDIVIVFGGLGTGETITNTATAVYKGSVLCTYNKILLPTYDVFDEWRNFTAGSRIATFKHQGVKFGITICEDIWANRTFTSKHNIQDKYTVDPVKALSVMGCDIMLNLSASPFSRHKLDVRSDLLHTIAVENQMHVVYCNMVGGNDSLVFDGNSMAVNNKGEIVATGCSYGTDLIYVDFNNPAHNTCHIQQEEELSQVWSALVLGVRDYVHKCGFTDVVIGLSGGIDSALVTAIAVEALGAEHVTCITMPSAFSSTGSVTDSVELATSHDVTLHSVSIQPIKETFRDEIVNKGVWYDPESKEWFPSDLEVKGLADENIQARIRGTILMVYSNQNRALVLSTGNKSETAVGYCTLYGDMCGGLSVIADVPKTMVYELAKWYNAQWERLVSLRGENSKKRYIPKNIITKAPSAELAPGQTDQQSLPPYDVLDAIIEKYVEQKTSKESIVYDLHDVIDPKEIHRVLGLIDRAEYKRQQAAPTIKITSKAWGGRFMPIAKKSMYR